MQSARGADVEQSGGRNRKDRQDDWPKGEAGGEMNPRHRRSVGRTDGQMDRRCEKSESGEATGIQRDGEKQETGRKEGSERGEGGRGSRRRGGDGSSARMGRKVTHEGNARRRARP